jgi:transposase
MKEYKLDTDILDLFPAIRKSLKDQSLHHFYFGLDAELSSCAVSIITDGCTPVYFGKFTREAIVALAARLVERDHSVSIVQEACGFGYEFHRDLLATGALSIVAAPEMLNGKRKTDKADSRKLASDLYAWLELKNKSALRPVRVPGLDEQQLRALHRERSQCVSLRNQIAAHGRSLAVSFNVLQVPAKWHGKKNWAAWKDELESGGQHWLIERLESKLPLIYRLEEQIAALEDLSLQIAFEKEFPTARENPSPAEAEATPVAAAPVEAPPANAKQFADYLKTQIPKGLGVATCLNLNAEICDWDRFNNRKQVGSYIGACPSEHSSGPNQQLGSIDRMGNCAVRTMLVEAAWRMVRYQPNWRGVKKHYSVLKSGSKASGRQRRIAIVAVARLLSVDLWRLSMGTCTMEDLGFIPAG